MNLIIQSINWSKILDKFQSAKEKIVLIMPAIHKEWIDAIYDLNLNKNLEVWICIDNQEEVYRSGYGDIESLKKLRSKNATIKQCDNIRVSFLGIDDLGWSLFLESRIISGNPEGLNAISLNNEDVTKILQSVFPEKYSNNGNSDALPDARPLLQEQLEEVEGVLKKNPPIEPDLQRQISTYNTIFQYAELHFEGGNLKTKTVSIPKAALPFKDDALKKRMKARLNLFTKEDTEKWNELIEVKNKIEEIRKEHLVSCSLRKDKSILRKEKKAAFEKVVAEVKEFAKSNMSKLHDKIQGAINSAEDTLRAELEIFFQSNPPDSVKNLTDPIIRKRRIESEISKTLSQIKLSSANEIITKIKISAFYYELTWEDLNDKIFLKWFKDKGLITKVDESQLAKFSRAFQIRK